MNEVMKRRLIGSLLLICVFASIAFYLINNAETEEKPEVQTVNVLEKEFESSIKVVEDISELERLINLDTQDTDSSLSTNKESSVEEVVVDKLASVPRQDSTKEQHLWVVQLASFTVLSNAQALEKKLVKLGYDAKITQPETNSKPLYRVRLKPLPSKDKANALAEELSEKLNIKP
jgi:cell division protein FtsN